MTGRRDRHKFHVAWGDAASTGSCTESTRGSAFPYWSLVSVCWAGNLTPDIVLSSWTRHGSHIVWFNSITKIWPHNCNKKPQKQGPVLITVVIWILPSCTLLVNRWTAILSSALQCPSNGGDWNGSTHNAQISCQQRCDKKATKARTEAPEFAQFSCCHSASSIIGGKC